MKRRYPNLPGSSVYPAAAVLLTLLSILPGCAHQAVGTSSIPPLTNQPVFSAPDVDVLSVSSEMRQFLDRYAGEDLDKNQRTWALVHALSDRNLSGFHYDPYLTLTAGESFSRRSGNCLSYSSLVIALAREAGLNAWYQVVKLPPSWDNADETMLVSMHINAVVESGRGTYTLDVSGEKLLDSYRRRKVSDAQATAHYFNNLGVNALLKDDLPRAWAYFVKGVRTSPDSGFIWSNLGVAYKRNDQPAQAREMYETALRIDPSQMNAANNLFQIHEAQGNITAANALRSQVDRHRRKNPYHLAAMSMDATENGRHDEASRLLRRAVNLENKDYRLHLALAQSLFLQGDARAAAKSLEKARTLAPDAPELSAAETDFPSASVLPQP